MVLATRTRCVLAAVLLITLCGVGFEGTALDAQTPAVKADTLKFALVLSRHGVRTPTNTPEDLQDYAPQPWPRWDAPAAYLTPRGNTLMRLLGVYYRQYLSRAGLLRASGCADLDKFYFWSDTTGRDIESAWALGHAMLPDCNVTIHRLAEGRADPIFAPRIAGVGTFDVAKARTALLQVIGDSPEAVLERYRGDLEAIEQLLFGCAPSPSCPPASRDVRKRIIKQESLLVAENGAASSPAIAAAHAVAEAVLLEYLNGVPEQDIAWGRFNNARMRALLKFETRYWNTIVTPYASRAGASNLLARILRSLDQANSGAAVPGALGKPGDKALFLVGHDSDIKRIAVMLGLSWTLENGSEPNEVLPGASLIFELWRDGATGTPIVRTYLQSQTYAQIRRMTPLSLRTPPVRLALTIPGCASAAKGAPCEWGRFKTALESGIDPAFVEPFAAAAR
jgi:4-phytase/acid phosphatase